MNRMMLIALLATAAACTNAAEGSKPDRAASDERQKTEKTPPKARAQRVEVAVIGESRAALDLTLPGEVEGSREAMLASPLGGYVERVLADVGDEVRAGQALAWVNKSQLDLSLEQAKVQVEQTKTDLEAVERAGKSVPKTRRDAARFAATGAQAAYDLAKLQSERAVVRAPFAGVIADRRIEQGEVLPPGGDVMRLVKVDPIRISLSVSDHDVVNLKKGMAVQVMTDARSGILEGTIERVSPAASLNTRTFEVLVELKNPEQRLKPGMIATVRARVAVDGDSISLPQYVLVTRLDGNGVFVEENGVAQWRPVELGSVVRGQVLVESGLKVGDRVVVTGHRELAAGDKLIIAREGACCTDGRITFGSE